MGQIYVLVFSRLRFFLSRWLERAGLGGARGERSERRLAFAAERRRSVAEIARRRARGTRSAQSAGTVGDGRAEPARRWSEAGGVRGGVQAEQKERERLARSGARSAGGLGRPDPSGRARGFGERGAMRPPWSDQRERNRGPERSGARPRPAARGG